MDIKPAIFAVLDQDGKVVGTGFLVAPRLAVTCAHVIFDAGAIAGDNVQIRFSDKKTKTSAVVISEFWRDVDQGDIAFLQLISIPKDVFPLRLAPATDSRPGSSFLSFGYATAADVQGIAVHGTIDDYLPEHKLLQIQAPQANHGISGAPVFDEKRSVVVGMITKGHTELGRNELTTFATPTELLWEAYPEIKPATPPLPHRDSIVEGIHLLPYDYDQRIQNFLTEYLGTDTHPVPFGGREEALRMLDAWLAETTPYLLLAAPAGRGKSALLVRWLDSLKQRKDLALAFVPVSIRFGTNMERFFYAALAARLAFLHGDDIPASPETSTAVYRGFVSNYLSKPLANMRTLLVVLDGLDEAADWQAGADFVPNELPNGVRVVVSARFLAGDADSTSWLRRLNWERSGLARAPSLTPLDRAGVADVLLKMGCPLDKLSRKVDIVAELYRLSEGDPLLVGLYVGDLWAKGEEVTRLGPEDLASIQPGYKGYFDRWWDDQKRLWGKDKPWLEQHVRAMRNLLSGALGPLFKSDFHALEPELNSDYITDALDILRRFIIGDNHAQGYTLSHPKLGQYFWDSLFQTERAQIESRFLDWGEQTLLGFVDGKHDPRNKFEIPAYVVRNYSTHLARARQPIERWLQLTYHQQWAQAWFTLEGAYGGYLQDVQKVREQCKALDRRAIIPMRTPPFLSKQIRCALIEASLHSLAGNIPAELVGLLVRDGIWTVQQLWVVIRQMPVARQQVEAIEATVPYLTEQQFLNALDVVQTIKDEEYCVRSLDLLLQHIPEDNLFQTVRIIRSIKSEEDRADLLLKLAQRMPEDQLFIVLEIGTTLKSEIMRLRLLVNIIARTTENQLILLLEATRNIQSEKGRAEALIAMAMRFPRMLNKAIKATKSIENEGERADVIGIVKDCNLNEKQLVQVFRIANTIKEEKYRAHALISLAQLLSTPQLSTVLDGLSNIMDEGNRTSVLMSLIERLPDEMLKRALIIAREVEKSVWRSQLFTAISKRMPEITDEALESAQEIWDGHERILALLALANQISKDQLHQILKKAWEVGIEWERIAGLIAFDKNQSEGQIAQILEAAKDLEDEDVRVIVLMDLVDSLPENASIEVLKMMRYVRNEQNRTGILSSLVHRLPLYKLGQILKMAQNVSNASECISLLDSLAQRLPPEQLKKVLEMAKGFYNEDCASLLSTLTQRLPEDQLEDLLEMIQDLDLDNELDRISILCELAQRMPEALNAALVIISSIEDEHTRSRSMFMLAKRAPEAMLKELLSKASTLCQVKNYLAFLIILARRMPDATLEALRVSRFIGDEDAQVDLLSRLVSRLDGEQLKEVMRKAKRMQNEQNRAHLLRALASRIPDDGNELLSMAEQIHDESIRIRLYCVLAKHLPDVQLLKLIEMAQGINSKKARIELLNMIAQRAPKNYLIRILTATKGTEKNETAYARLLETLAQRIPGQYLKQIAEEGKSIIEKQERIHVLKIISQRELGCREETTEDNATTFGDDAGKIMDDIVPSRVARGQPRPLLLKTLVEGYWKAESLICSHAQRTRPYLLSSFACHFHVFSPFGSHDTSREIYEAVCDVTTWWP